ncbi:Alpha-crystallin B chain [Blattella germanica]|nr:Alpha-crystallin B chain [Blattella germanica]
MSVQQFEPQEIAVKMVGDFLVVEGRHKERKDKHGFISRQFQRRYKFPTDVEENTIVCQISSDGILTVTAPKKTLTKREKIIPITLK